MSAPYRDNAAPLAPDLWDGSVMPGVSYVGSTSRLVIASNGKVYNRDTREEVRMKPIRARWRWRRGRWHMTDETK